MAKNGTTATKQPLWIVVSEQRDGEYFHLTAKVSTDKHESGAGRVPYGLDDQYGFEGKPLLSGLQARCQGDQQSRLRNDREAVYGYDVEFKDRWQGIKTNDCKRMLTTLQRVDRGFAKLADARGYVKSYGEYLGRLAEVLGCTGFAIQKTSEQAMRSGQGWDWLSIGDGVNRVNHRIYVWQQEGIELAAGVRYEVNVGNVGCVHRGLRREEAYEIYREYVTASQTESGRVSGEPVTLFVNDEPKEEYQPSYFGEAATATGEEEL